MPANWTEPVDWEVDQLVTNEDLNEQVRDNLLYLHTPNAGQVIRSNGGNYQLVNSTTFVDIDSTNLTITLTTTGGYVYMKLSATVILGASEQANFDFSIDGNRVGAAYTEGLRAVSTGAVGAAVEMGVEVDFIKLDLDAGTYVIRPQWSTGSGDTVDLVSNTTECPIIFTALEL